MNRFRSSVRPFVCSCLSWVVLAVLAAVASAEAPRVLEPGKLPDDRRLGDLITLDGYFPFAVPGTPDAWAERSERVHRQMLVTLGLWPMPTKTPASAVVHGKIDRGEYKKLRNVGYRYGDRVGKAGIERQHETRLRGERGVMSYSRRAS